MMTKINNRSHVVNKNASFYLWGFLFWSSTISAQVAELPPPANGVYEQSFKYKIGSVIPADLNGDGRLDFVSRSQYVGSDSLIWMEFRLYNQSGGEPHWEFNTNIVCRSKANPPGGRSQGKGYSTYTDVPSIAWDWDGDDRWEVYFAYYNPGQSQWRHRIVDGNGNTLADAEMPSNCNWESTKTMPVLCKYNGVTRVAVVEDGMTDGGVSMFEIRDGAGNWSLDQMWFFNGEDVVSHDMVRSADIDMNGSDDELLLGGIVLNADGSVRYRMDDKLGVSGFGRSDQVLLGYFDPSRPSELVMVCGDDYVGGDWKTYIGAVYARTGEKLFVQHMEDWTHWHTGWAIQSENGTEIIARDRDTAKWARFEISGSFAGMVSHSDGNMPSGKNPLKWNDNEFDEVNVSGTTGSGSRADLGGSGTEEIIEHRGVSPENVLRITFNQNSNPNFPSRWQNEQYRKDVMLFNSGYAPYWLGAITIPPRNSEPGTLPEPDTAAPERPKNVEIRGVD